MNKLEKFFTRDNIIWSLGFFGSVLLFMISHTSLIPENWHEHAQDIAAVAGFISGKLGWSSLPTRQTVIENQKRENNE